MLPFAPIHAASHSRWPPSPSRQEGDRRRRGREAGVPNKRRWFVGVGNSERRPAIGNQCLALFARRTSDGGSDQRERGAKPRVEAALPRTRTYAQQRCL